MLGATEASGSSSRFKSLFTPKSKRNSGASAGSPAASGDTISPKQAQHDMALKQQQLRREEITAAMADVGEVSSERILDQVAKLPNIQTRYNDMSKVVDSAGRWNKTHKALYDEKHPMKLEYSKLYEKLRTGLVDHLDKKLASGTARLDDETVASARRQASDFEARAIPQHSNKAFHGAKLAQAEAHLNKFKQFETQLRAAIAEGKPQLADPDKFFDYITDNDMKDAATLAQRTEKAHPAVLSAIHVKAMRDAETHLNNYEHAIQVNGRAEVQELNRHIGYVADSEAALPVELRSNNSYVAHLERARDTAFNGATSIRDKAERQIGALMAQGFGRGEEPVEELDRQAFGHRSKLPSTLDIRRQSMEKHIGAGNIAEHPRQAAPPSENEAGGSGA